MSTDGLNYVNATADVTPTTSTSYSPFGPDGYPAIDQVTGKVFQAAGCTTNNGCTSSGLWMNIGTPDSTGTLKFLDDNGAGGQDLKKLVHIADTPTGSPDTLFSVLSMDSGRNLEVLWTGNNINPRLPQTMVNPSTGATGSHGCTAAVQ